MNIDNLAIYTTADLLTAAAEALNNQDMDMLEALQRISAGWMQDSTEANAQRAMLDAMMAAVDAMEHA